MNEKNNIFTAGEKTSGKLKNPGKKYFLTLLNTVMETVNRMRTEDNLSYIRMSLIMCGLVKDLNRMRHIEQPLKQIQESYRTTKKILTAQLLL